MFARSLHYLIVNKSENFLEMHMMTHIRNFYTSSSLAKQIKLKNTKNKGVSSHNWLLRQLKDPYVEKAKLMNYRYY